MKKALAFGMVFILSFLPLAGVFADDDDYPDRQSNLVPYFQPIIDLFTYDVEATSCQADGIEYWHQGTSYGKTYDYAISIPNACDCIDYDIVCYTGGPFSSSYVYLFELTAFGLANVDYVEVYQQGSYESYPVYYVTYYGNKLYVVCSGNQGSLSSGTYFTIRVHISHGGFTLTRYVTGGTFITTKYAVAGVGNNSVLTNLGTWAYLNNLLREVNDLNINVNSVSGDFSSLQSSIDSIDSYIRSNFAYYTNYMKNPPSYSYSVHVVFKNPFQDNVYFNTKISSSTTGNTTIPINANYGDFDLYIGLNTAINVTPYPKFINVYIPCSSFNIPTGTTLTVSFTQDNFRDDPYNLDFDQPNSLCNWRTVTLLDGQFYFMVDIYNPHSTYNFNAALKMLWLKIHIDYGDLGTGQITIPKHVEFTGPTYRTVSLNFNNLGTLKGIEYLVEGIYNILNTGGGASGGDSTSYPDYPSSPSDPSDPSSTTNIYDVDIEFNNTVGDISVFETQYQSLFEQYNQQFKPSDYKLGGSGLSDTFTGLNSVFSDIWNDFFITETVTDENDEEQTYIIGGLGLFIIIPLILFVVLALFRRVTS